MAAPTASMSPDRPQLHGPYALWTGTADNKAVTRRLAEPELSPYRPWFENAKQLRALATALQALTLGMVQTPPCSRPTDPAPPGAKARPSLPGQVRPSSSATPLLCRSRLSIRAPS